LYYSYILEKIWWETATAIHLMKEYDEPELAADDGWCLHEERQFDSDATFRRYFGKARLQ